MTNWVNSINVENEGLRSKCNNLYQNLDQVAKVAIGGAYAQRLLPFMETSGYFRLSDHFPGGYKTIIGADDLSMYIQGGEYAEMVRRQCVVTICASMEAFVRSLFPIMGWRTLMVKFLASLQRNLI